METEEEKKQREKDQYRFSGYQLPKIQLDGTGDSYIVLPPHPGITHSPAEWEAKKATWEAGTESKN